MHSKGFTLIELLAVIIILAIILGIAVPSITKIVTNVKADAFEANAKMLIRTINDKKAEDSSFDPESINETNVKEKLNVSADNYSSLIISNNDGKISVSIVGANKWDNLEATGTYDNIVIKDTSVEDTTPPVITIVGNSTININVGSTYTDQGATASDNIDGNITNNIIATGTVDTTIPGTYSITYNVKDTAGNEAIPVVRTVNVVDPNYIVSEGVNKPRLAAGMTAVKWSNGSWITIDNPDTDTSWYDYANKEWANAKTSDGSFWVWVPRYAYQIATNYHTNTVGTINIKFLKGTTNAASDDSSVSTTPTYDGSSQTNYILEPAFTFGSTDLTGFWVAKFEPSNDGSNNIKIVPNVSSWRDITLTDAYNLCRSLETNSIYGWGTSGSGIDSHLIKNTEWGAVAYLAQSTYGKNGEVWINNSNTYTTGCAGSSVSASQYTGCQYSYETVNGVKASTTDNIYGIYDMVGGAYEFVSAYVNNSFASTFVFYTVDSKYKDVYSITSDSAINNYNDAVNKKGDALYETSNNVTGAYSWYSDNSYMPYSGSVGFNRGGSYIDGSKAGLFTFNGNNNVSNVFKGFRPVLIVDTGL